MRVLVMGAGGVGGHYGGMLASAGHDVTFVARGPHLAAMQARGLELRTGAERVLLHPVRAVDTPPSANAAGRIDLVLFTVKTYDTLPAIDALRPAVGLDTAVLTLQNGVESTDHLAAAFGPQSVLAGTTVMTSVVVAPGVIETVPSRSLVLAERSETRSTRAQRFAAVFRGLGVDVKVATEWQPAIWEKFVLLAALATITTACDLPVGPIREAQESAELLRALMAEVANVGRACGISLPANVEQSAWDRVAAAPASARSSMQLDYEARHRAELEQLTGAAVRLGRQHGVSIPRLETLYAVLKLRAQAFGGLSS